MGSNPTLGVVETIYYVGKKVKKIMAVSIFLAQFWGMVLVDFRVSFSFEKEGLVKRIA